MRAAESAKAGRQQCGLPPDSAMELTTTPRAAQRRHEGKDKVLFGKMDSHRGEVNRHNSLRRPSGSTGFSGLCFATALGAIAAKSKRSASPYSTNLLVLIVFIIRLSQCAFTGNNERFDLLFLLSNAILEHAQEMEFRLGMLVLLRFSCEGQWPERDKMVALGPGLIDWSWHRQVAAMES